MKKELIKKLCDLIAEIRERKPFSHHCSYDEQTNGLIRELYKTAKQIKQL